MDIWQLYHHVITNQDAAGPSWLMDFHWLQHVYLGRSFSLVLIGIMLHALFDLGGFKLCPDLRFGCVGAQHLQ